MKKKRPKAGKLAVFTILLVLALVLALALLFPGKRAGTETTDAKANLGKFYYLTRDDPLFYSPYMNTTELRISIKNILATERSVTENLNIPLFPDEYLLYLPDAIDANSRFFAEPTEENAEELLSWYEKTAAAYESGIAELIKSYTPIANNNMEFVFFAQSTNNEIIMRDLELIRENAAQLKGEILKRKDCLHYGDCGQTEKTVQAPAIQGEEGNFSLAPFELLMKNFSYVKGPYIVKSPCWGWDKGFLPKSYLMYLFYVDGRPFPKLATEIYYWNVTYRPNFTVSGGPVPYLNYSRELIRRGVTLNDQPEALDYRCPDQEFYCDVTTLDFFIDRLKEKRIFTDGIKDYISAGDFRLGSMLESKLLSDAYPSSDDMERLGILYSRVYEILKEKNVSDTELIWNYRMLIENRMVMLAGILDSAQRTLEIQKMISEINQDRDILYLLSVRTDYSLMFSACPKSVWRVDSNPQYLIKRDSPLQPAYVLYSQIRNKPLAELRKYQVNDYEITKEILAQMR